MYVENKKNNLQGIWMLQEEVRGKYKDEDVEERRLLHLPLPWYTHHSKIFFSRLLIILAFPKLPFYLRLSVSLVWNDNDGNLKVEEFRFWWSNPLYCDVFVKKGLEWSLFLCSLMSPQLAVFHKKSNWEVSVSVWHLTLAMDLLMDLSDNDLIKQFASSFIQRK